MPAGYSSSYYQSQLLNGAGTKHKKKCHCPCGCTSTSNVCSNCGCADIDVPGVQTNLGDTGSQYVSILQSDGVPTTANYSKGTNVFTPLTPVLTVTSPSTNEVAVTFDGESAYFFTQHLGPPPTFTPKFDVDAQLVFDPTTNEYQFTTSDGQSYWFNPRGVFLARQSGDDQIDAALDDNGRIATLTRTTGGVTDKITYERNSQGLVTSMTSQQISGTTSNIRRVEYAYYGVGELYGNSGDLKTATVLAWDGSAWQPLETSYYRYYKAGSSLGFQHGLQYVLGPAAFARLAEVTDPYTATPATVAQYADNYFEYDPTTHQATVSKLQGGLLTYAYDYSANPLSPAKNYSNWQLKTVETRPDSSTNTTYSNYLSQVLLTDLASGSDHWIEYLEINGRGLVVLDAKPSAVASYDDSSSAIVISYTGGGLILTTVYYTSTTATLTTPGGVLDQVQFTYVKHGNGGTPIKQSQTKYFLVTLGTGYFYSVANNTSYPNASESGDGNAVTTNYTYEWYSLSTQMSQQITAVPQIPAAQNGAGNTTGDPQYYRRQYFDDMGNMLAGQDERNYVNTYQYDPATGARTRMIQDDNLPAILVGDWPDPPATPPARLQLTTDYTVDLLGRTIQTLAPQHGIDLGGSTATNIRTATWTVYQDILDQVCTAQGYLNVATSELTLVNPVSVEFMPVDGLTRTSVQAIYSGASVPPPVDQTFDQSTWVRWSVDIFNIQSQKTASRVYFLIPTSGTGTVGINYDQTNFGYDAINRVNKSVSPTGTITRTVYDVRDNSLSTWVGTNDTGATDTNPAGSGAPNNMLVVTENQYDDGAAGLDGILTQTTDWVDATNSRITSFDYDWRDRQTTVIGEEGYCVVQTLDNMGRATQVNRYDTSPSGTKLTQSTTSIDDLGRTYKSAVYSVTGGTASNPQTSKIWYDPSGNQIKNKPAGSSGWTKTTFDSVGRTSATFMGYSTATETYAEAGTISTSVVFEQTIPVYDAASNVIETDSYQRDFNAPTTGTPSMGALNGIWTSANPTARVTFVAMYPDGIGRTVNTANYGTNGNTAFTRPGVCPARSASVLVSTSIFNDRGEAFQTVDPMGTVNQQTWDDAGRVTQTIQNYVSGGTDADQNMTVNQTYNPDSKVATLTAVNASTGDQVTSFSYGITVAGGSTLNSNSVLHTVTYPDGGTVTNEYNRQGDVIQMTDQNGTVHEYAFDGLGRSTSDAVTTVASDVDTTVLRIETTYEIRGKVQNTTSYDAASGGSVVNDVQRVYNGFQQLITEYQENSGAVNTSTSPKVQYTYADGSANTIRPMGIVYPNGNTLASSYGTSGGPNDLLSRIQSLIFNTSEVTEYTYLGLNTPVVVDYPEPGIQYNLATGTSPNVYAGLDIFGRVIDCLWQTTATSPTALVQLGYGYDQASNRLWRQDVVAGSANFDELYAYDGLYRLDDMQRGRLNGTQTGMNSGTLNFEQDWTLDPTGNWQGFIEDASGTSVTLNQTRTANPVNEITSITNSVGSPWAQPGYDAAGNMTTIPQPNSLGNRYTGTFDPWQRLTQLLDPATSDIVQQNQYDGRNFRIAKLTYASGTLSETRQFYYTDTWQALEERIVGTTPECRYVWGLRYIDDLVLRDRSVSGTLDERLYAMQDANWNMVAICDTSANVQERFAYSPYGVVLPLNPNFSSPYTGTDYDWTVLSTGRDLDSVTGMFNYRERYYHSALGLFIRRDALFYIDEELYAYTNGSPLNRTDPFGTEPTNKSGEPTLKFEWQTNSSDYRLGKCGDFNFSGSWKLENATGVNGWIIQKIIVAGRVFECCNRPSCFEATKFIWFGYYEAWQVVDGTIYQGEKTGLLSEASGEDTFSNPDVSSCTRGYMNVVGTAQFIRNYKLAFPPWSRPEDKGHFGKAGDLPSMPLGKSPEGFDIRSALRHRVSVEWDCCSGLKLTEVDRIVPKFGP